MDKIILSDTNSTDSFVECSRRNLKTTGRLFKKQIFAWGEFSHPNNPDIKINVDQKFYESLKRNFDNGVCPIVQVPLVDDYNRHVEDPARNIGEVVDMSYDDEGVYVYIDARKHAEDIGSTILGASAKVSLNYSDTRNNTHVGPTLLHVAATNRPFLVNLKDYETVSASNADTTEDVVLLLSRGNDVINPKEETNMTKEELIAALSEYSIDVAAGQQALADLEGYVALSSVLGDDSIVATPDTLSNTIVDLTNSLQERDAKIEEQETRLQDLTAQIQEINLSAATAEVESLIEKSRIRPVTKVVMIDLSMNDRERFELFLIPEEEAQIELSEQGFTTSESSQEKTPEERAREIGARLAELTK